VISHLLEGRVRHRRAEPFAYGLEHEVYYVAVDIDEVDEIASLRLVSRNRLNMLSFHDVDHLDPPARDIRADVRAHLRAEGIEATGWQITLVTNLRVLGYVFNPASFYLCRDDSGALQAVIVEVHNTHHERHLYTLRPDAAGEDFRAAMDKSFYVSPFIDMVGRYTVRVRDEASRLRVTINLHDRGALLLHTSLDLTRHRLTDRALLRVFLRHPLVTHRTTALIHVHALRLWRRGARFHRHGEAVR
jgi:hypothetical protein